jgi:hypothetical protein
MRRTDNLAILVSWFSENPRIINLLDYSGTYVGLYKKNFSFIFYTVKILTTTKAVIVTKQLVFYEM